MVSDLSTTTGRIGFISEFRVLGGYPFNEVAMIEQILLSVSIVLTDVSMFLLVYSKRKDKLKFVYIAHTLFALVFISTNSFSVFSSAHYLFLIMYSWLIALLYAMIIVFFPIFISTFSTLIPKTYSTNLSTKLIRLTAFFVLLMQVVFQVILIWDLKAFNEVAKSLTGR